MTIGTDHDVPNDYSTINGAMDNIESSHNFATNNCARIHISSSSHADTTPVTIDVTGTSTTAYVIITVDSGARGDGNGSGPSLIPNSAGNHAIFINDDADYTVIEHLYIKQGNSGSSLECIRVEADDCLISRCVLETSNATQQDCIYTAANIVDQATVDLHIDNCHLHTGGRTGINCQLITTTGRTFNINVHNCSIHHCSKSGEANTGGIVAYIHVSGTINYNIYNTLVWATTQGNCFDQTGSGGTANWNGTDNIADDTSCESRFGAANSFDSANITTSDPSDTGSDNVWIGDNTGPTYDVSIQGEDTSTITQNGVDRTGSETAPQAAESAQDYSTDIIGTARDGTTPDIGCFELASGAIDVTPTAGTLTLTGATATVAFNFGFTPTAAALTLTGDSPTVDVERDVSVTAGTLTLTGATPTVALELGFSPTPGVLTLTGESPSIATKLNVAPDAGTLTLTGSSATVSIGLDFLPAAATLALTGESPTVVLSIVISPTAAALQITGASPTVQVVAEGDVQPTPGTLTLTGATADIGFKLNFAPNAAPLSISGKSVSVEIPGQIVPKRGGGSGAKSRRVMIGRRRFRVRSERELRRLLEEYRAELEEQREEAPPAEAKQITRRLVKVRQKIQQIDDGLTRQISEDDEILVIWASLH